MQALATDVEKDLIYLSAALDEIGLAARHGLHFRINRSRYYVSEFESLLKSLKIGNIDTWVAYDQFVTRGLKPAFDFIDGVGKRLAGLRTRLESVLEGIETSALVIQTSATRSNTAQLKRIARGLQVEQCHDRDHRRRAHLFCERRIVGRCIGETAGARSRKCSSSSSPSWIDLASRRLWSGVREPKNARSKERRLGGTRG